MKTKVLTLLLALCGLVSFGQCPQPKNYSGYYYWDNGEFGARLAWDRAEHEVTLDRFEVYRSPDGINFKLIKRIVNTPSISHYECVDDELDKPGEFYYQLIAFYQDGCQSEPLVTMVNVTSAEEFSTENLSLYPNPTTGFITITAINLQQINIINSLGQTLDHIETEGNKADIDLSPYGKGVFMLMIQAENSITVRKVIVK